MRDRDGILILSSLSAWLDSDSLLWRMDGWICGWMEVHFGVLLSLLLIPPRRQTHTPPITNNTPTNNTYDTCLFHHLSLSWPCVWFPVYKDCLETYNLAASCCLEMYTASLVHVTDFTTTSLVCITEFTSTSQVCIIYYTTTSLVCITEFTSTSQICIIYYTFTSLVCITDFTSTCLVYVTDDLYLSGICDTLLLPVWYMWQTTSTSLLYVTLYLYLSGICDRIPLPLWDVTDYLYLSSPCDRLYLYLLGLYDRLPLPLWALIDSPISVTDSTSMCCYCLYTPSPFPASITQRWLNYYGNVAPSPFPAWNMGLVLWVNMT